MQFKIGDKVKRLLDSKFYKIIGDKDKPCKQQVTEIKCPDQKHDYCIQEISESGEHKQPIQVNSSEITIE